MFWKLLFIALVNCGLLQEALAQDSTAVKSNSHFELRTQHDEIWPSAKSSKMLYGRAENSQINGRTDTNFLRALVGKEDGTILSTIQVKAMPLSADTDYSSVPGEMLRSRINNGIDLTKPSIAIPQAMPNFYYLGRLLTPQPAPLHVPELEAQLSVAKSRTAAELLRLRPQIEAALNEAKLRPLKTPQPALRELNAELTRAQNQRTTELPQITQNLKAELARENTRSVRVPQLDAELRQAKTEMDAQLATAKPQIKVQLHGANPEVEAELAGAKLQMENQLAAAQRQVQAELAHAKPQMEAVLAQIRKPPVVALPQLRAMESAESYDTSIVWDRWYKNLAKLYNAALKRSLEKYGNPSGSNSILLTIWPSHHIAISLEYGKCKEFDTATIEAYSSLEGNPALAYPAGSQRQKLIVEIQNDHSIQGMVSSTKSRTCIGDTEVQRYR